MTWNQTSSLNAMSGLASSVTEGATHGKMTTNGMPFARARGRRPDDPPVSVSDDPLRERTRRYEACPAGASPRSKKPTYMGELVGTTSTRPVSDNRDNRVSLAAAQTTTEDAAG